MHSIDFEEYLWTKGYSEDFTEEISFSACSLSDGDSSLSFELPLPAYRAADNQPPVYAVGVTVYDSLSFEKLAVKDFSLTLKPCSLVTFLADFEDIEDGSTYIASSSSGNVYCFYVTLAVKYSNGFSMNDVCKNLNEMWIVPESNLTSATPGQEYSQSQIDEAKQDALAKNPVFTATKTFTTSSSSDTVTLSVD